MRRGIRTLRRFYQQLLDLFLPPCCVGCGRVETWLCGPCAEKIPIANRPVCPRCGDSWTGSGLCPRCRTTPLRVAPIYSVFLYDGIVRDAIHALKYRGGQDVVEPLSSRMAESWHDRGLQSDLLVPVPLHESREAERGYNQSALLARALAPRVGVPSEEALLFRVRRTASQTKLSQAERWHNVRDAFACVETYDLSNLSLTLVDDVATTGATLDACAVALLDRGARVVNAFTLARAA